MVRMIHVLLCSLFVLTLASGAPAQQVLQSGNIRLEVTTGSSYSYKVIDTSTNTTLVQQNLTQFDGSSVVSTGSATVGSTFMTVPLNISGGNSGVASFAFTAPGVLEVDLAGTGGYTAGTVKEQFTDLNETYYGVWEHASTSYPFTGGVATLTNDGRSAAFDGDDTLDLITDPGRDGKIFAPSARAPFYMTNKNVGVYAQTLASGNYAFAGSTGGNTSMDFNTTSLKYNILAGSDSKDVLSKYNSLNGGCYVPADWAFDSIWWRDDPTGTAQAVSDAAMLQNLQIHSSGYWLDRPYQSDNWGYGNMDFHPTKYPDADAMARTLKDTYGLNLMVWIANRADTSGDLYAEANALGYLFDSGDGITQTGSPAIDIRNPEAYAWLKGKLDELLMSATDASGNSLVKGYKIDRGGEGGIPMDLINELVPLFNQLTYEGLADRHGDDFYSFSRSLNDTSRQHTAHWNGDPTACFSSLELTVAEGIRAGLMNFAMWGSDIGSYENNPTAELQNRWVAYGAYTPMMEGKLEGRDWYYQTDATSLQVQNITRKFAKEHHMLIPYVRSLIAESNRSGLPAIRAMFLEYGDDPNTADMLDQYMYGPNMLVAPVIQEGVTSRNVYLPQGKWVNYNDKSTVHDASAGGMNITASAPIDEIPVFVKAGAIITRGDIVKGNNTWDADWTPSLLFEVFAFEGISSSFDYWNGEAFSTILAGLDGGEMTVAFGDLGGIDGEFEIYLMEGSMDSLVVNGATLTEGLDYSLVDGVASFNMSVAPEPASLSLLALGGVGLLRRRSGHVLRRRKRPAA